MRRLEYDVAGDVSTARLRLVGAAMLMVCTAALLLSRPPVIGWLFAAVAVFVATHWIRSFYKVAARSAEAAEWFMLLTGDELAISEGRRTTRIPWTCVASIECDEDKLLVEVRTQEGALHWIEPRYAGLSLHGLRDTLVGYCQDKSDIVHSKEMRSSCRPPQPDL